MAESRIQKQQERVLKAQEQLGVTLVKEREAKRKRRDGRMLKLGVLAEQMFLAGDVALLGRFEQAALAQFGDRKIDRLDFEFDEALHYFDKTREDALVAKSQKGEASRPPVSPIAPSQSAASGTKPAPSPASRPPSSAASVNGTPVSSGPVNA